MDITAFSVLGKTVQEPVETLDIINVPEQTDEITMKSTEVTSLCPVTGQPDFSTVTITFKPNEYGIESKSLKLYLWSFREKGTFCEKLADEIAQTVFNAIHPRWLSVTVDQAPRGGISISARSFVKGR